MSDFPVANFLTHNQARGGTDAEIVSFLILIQKFDLIAIKYEGKC